MFNNLKPYFSFEDKDNKDDDVAFHQILITSIFDLFLKTKVIFFSEPISNELSNSNTKIPPSSYLLLSNMNCIQIFLL